MEILFLKEFLSYVCGIAEYIITHSVQVLASIKSRMSLPRDPFLLSSGILVRVGFKKMFGDRLNV